MMRIYVSGAIRHDPDHRTKFARARNLVLSQHPESVVTIPVDIAHQMHSKSSEADYLLADLETIKTWATHLVRIAEDIPSAGADIECAFAEYAGVARLPDLEVSYGAV